MKRNLSRLRRKRGVAGAQDADGDVVLLKASRGVKLEKALEGWKNGESGLPKNVATS